MHKVTRISYNSGGWIRPTGEARGLEGGGTYNAKHGFGHEDWLFRSEWRIDGWRYAFIQGVNKSHAKLVKEGQAFDLTLFTIDPDKKRRYVATLYDVECLNEQQAGDARDAFNRLGWLDEMRKDILAVHGAPDVLGAPEWAKHILNVRFRQENVCPFPPNTFAEEDDGVMGLQRYQLVDLPVTGTDGGGKGRLPGGSITLPDAKEFLRKGSAEVQCTPEHARMQAKLMQELQVEYLNCKVMREHGFIDVSVRTETELLLFEIKSDLEPRTVIRQALGQILEYGFHPSRTHDLPVKLVIVGRQPLSDLDEIYLSRLQKDFYLPITYRVISL